MTAKTKKKAHWSRKLGKLDACSKAKNWARRQPNLRTAWTKCKRADWMLWLIFRTSAPLSVERRLAILAACACARRALRFVPSGEERPRLAIEAAERVGNGDISEQARAAARAANAAAYVAAYAADAAVCAAYAARASRAAARAAYAAEQKACADAIRALCPHAPKLAEF